MAELDRKPAPKAKNPLSWTITPVDSKGGVVGATLRVAREERGLSLDDVAAVLKIRREHIGSIEKGRIDDLPGLPYAIGFIRTYAEYLGMDGLDVVRRFKEEISKPEDDGELEFPAPISGRKLPIALLIAVPVILAVALYGAWFFFLRDDTATVDAPAAPVTETTAVSSTEAGPAAEPVATAAPADAAPVAPAPAPAPIPATESETAPKPSAETEAESASPAEPASDEAPPAAPATAPAQPAVTPGANSGTAEAAVEGAATEAEEGQPPSSDAAETEAASTESEAPASASTAPPSPAEEAEASPAASAVPAAEGQAVSREAEPAPNIEAESTAQDAAVPGAGQGIPGPSRIELRATSDSWVVIRDAQSKVLFARILGAGESYSVPSQPNLSMVTGNAGALDIYVDGLIIKPLGPMGAVRRDVALDPDEMLARQ